MVKMNTENLISVLPADIAASADLTKSQKLILGQLIIYSGLEEARNNDGWFYRSNEDLCSDIGVSENTLISARQKLHDYGYIDWRKGSRSTGATEYKVLIGGIDSTQIEPLTEPNCTHNCTHTLDDIYLVMSEILKELKHIGSIIGSVGCTHNCSDKGAKAQSNGEIEPNCTHNCTPDTDKELNTQLSSDNSEVTATSRDASSSGDNRKFSEQYQRILKACTEMRTAVDEEYKQQLQAVMDDAVEKARMYATEKQLSLIDCRIGDFYRLYTSDTLQRSPIDDINLDEIRAAAGNNTNTMVYLFQEVGGMIADGGNERLAMEAIDKGAKWLKRNNVQTPDEEIVSKLKGLWNKVNESHQVA